MNKNNAAPWVDPELIDSLQTTAVRGIGKRVSLEVLGCESLSAPQSNVRRVENDETLGIVRQKKAGQLENERQRGTSCKIPISMSMRSCWSHLFIKPFLTLKLRTILTLNSHSEMRECSRGRLGGWDTV